MGGLTFVKLFIDIACKFFLFYFRSIMKFFRSLQRLVLTSNWIDTIPLPDNLQVRLHGLKHLSLSFNRLKAWSDVDALSLWCPKLETLSLAGNPLGGRQRVAAPVLLP